ncbi:B-cell scaffold protein with ankyrin repeats-like [Sorex araneus]|uniref:B-cell scaffold protein with ankyrin repeats-like n=1 Tax=Sorex araneus TaxID=42254 RepID=UPI0024335E25|nr:B-cell scaffold protein with ankyrin repeats-like [Sorex araneus]
MVVVAVVVLAVMVTVGMVVRVWRADWRSGGVCRAPHTGIWAASGSLSSLPESGSYCAFDGYTDHLGVSAPTELRMDYPGGAREREGSEASPEARGGPQPAALVLPRDVLCENPGEIFIIFRDEEAYGTVEVEFRAPSARVSARPVPWSTTVWRTKAWGFPAGPVHVDVYCDGTIKATAEIKYHPRDAAGAVGPGDGGCREHLQELDETLTAVFKHELRPFALRPHRQCARAGEAPTLLRLAATLGLRRLAALLLGCSGAGGVAGMDPAGLDAGRGPEEPPRTPKDSASVGSERPEVQRGREERLVILVASEVVILLRGRLQDKRRGLVQGDRRQPPGAHPGLLTATFALTSEMRLLSGGSGLRTKGEARAPHTGPAHQRASSLIRLTFKFSLGGGVQPEGLQPPPATSVEPVFHLVCA